MYLKFFAFKVGKNVGCVKSDITEKETSNDLLVNNDFHDHSQIVQI